jgi:hypothetical protein
MYILPEFLKGVDVKGFEFKGESWWETRRPNLDWFELKLIRATSEHFNIANSDLNAIKLILPRLRDRVHRVANYKVYINAIRNKLPKSDEPVSGIEKLLAIACYVFTRGLVVRGGELFDVASNRAQGVGAKILCELLGLAAPAPIPPPPRAPKPITRDEVERRKQNNAKFYTHKKEKRRAEREQAAADRAISPTPSDIENMEVVDEWVEESAPQEGML